MKRRIDFEPKATQATPETSVGKTSNFYGKKKKKIFPYGNYDQYYGYRNPSKCDDPRLRFIPKSWIKGKDVLDIGCNTGHLTLPLARSHQPAKVDAIDIDDRLVGIARRNIVYYEQNRVNQKTDKNLNINNNEVATTGDLNVEAPKSISGSSLVSSKVLDEEVCHNDTQSVTCSSSTGLHVQSGSMNLINDEISNSPSRPIRDIVKFTCSNYVLKSDDLLDLCKEEYDVILMLSVSKWIHLNFGDDSLRRCFQRVYRQLRMNGIFLLEPQPFESYKRKKSLTPEISKVYPTIKFLPRDFHDYLISLGFTSSTELKKVDAGSQSFDKRSLIAYIKGEIPPSSSDTTVIT